MIGLRVGIAAGPRAGAAVGVSADPISSGGAQLPVGFVLLEGQSNVEGKGVFGSSGTASVPSSDSGFHFDVAFPAVAFNQNTATAPASPMVYNTNTGTEPLQTYAGAGVANMGLEQSLGRDLVTYGVFSAPTLAKMAIGSSSVTVNWLQSSLYPASGETVYAHRIAYGLARQAELGRKLECEAVGIGETDAATPARVLSCVADRNQYHNEYMDALGLGSAYLIILVLVNATTTAGDAAGYRAQELAWAAQWTRCAVRVIDPSDIPLAPDPHYGMTGYATLGSRIATVVASHFKPGQSLNLGSGPAPWVQQIAPGYTCQASPSVAKPLGCAQEQDGDWQYLICAAYSAATTITLTTAAGFTLVASDTSALSSTVRTMAIYERPVTAAILAAHQGADGIGHMPPPTIDFGTATLNVAEIITVRGPNKWTTSPTATSSVGHNNLNTTALSIAGGATPVNNCLMLIVMLTAGATSVVSTVVNGSLSGITVQRDSRFNPGSATICAAIATATMGTAGAYGATAVTFAAAGVNVGAVIAVKP